MGTPSVMLCKADLTKFLNHVGGVNNVMASVKLDGCRCLVTIHGPELTAKVSYTSRNGKTFKNFGCFNTEVRKVAKEMHKGGLEYPIHLDGEVCSGLEGQDFKAVMEQVHRMKDVDTSSLNLTLFDVIIPDMTFIWRHQVLVEAHMNAFGTAVQLDPSYTPSVKVLTHVPCPWDDEEEILAYAKTLHDSGIEGLVLKSMDGLYEGKKSIEWCKVKHMETYDCKVVGVLPGEGKHEGRMGALIVEYNGVQTKVGTGFSDEERELYNTQPPSMIEVKAQRIHPKSGKFIFPSYLRAREDKA